MSFPTDEEVRQAYKVISNHINTCSTRYDQDPLLGELRKEHPTLQMNLLRMLKTACADRITTRDGNVASYDGRYGKDWVDFVVNGCVPLTRGMKAMTATGRKLAFALSQKEATASYICGH